MTEIDGTCACYVPVIFSTCPPSSGHGGGVVFLRANGMLNTDKNTKKNFRMGPPIDKLVYKPL